MRLLVIRLLLCVIFIELQEIALVFRQILQDFMICPKRFFYYKNSADDGRK